MKWFKMFAEARNDAKLRTLNDSEFRVFFNLLCLASEQDERGIIDGYSDTLLAIETCNADEALLGVTLQKLCSLRVTKRDEDGKITFLNFEKRQHEKPSDTPQRVAQRVQKHREKLKNSDSAQNVTPNVTPCNAPVTPCNAENRIDKTREEEIRNGNNTHATGTTQEKSALNGAAVLLPSDIQTNVATQVLSSQALPTNRPASFDPPPQTDVEREILAVCVARSSSERDRQQWPLARSTLHDFGGTVEDIRAFKQWWFETPSADNQAKNNLFLVHFANHYGRFRQQKDARRPSTGARETAEEKRQRLQAEASKHRDQAIASSQKREEERRDYRTLRST